MDTWVDGWTCSSQVSLQMVPLHSEADQSFMSLWKVAASTAQAKTCYIVRTESRWCHGRPLDTAGLVSNPSVKKYCWHAWLDQLGLSFWSLLRCAALLALLSGNTVANTEFNKSRTSEQPRKTTQAIQLFYTHPTAPKGKANLPQSLWDGLCKRMSSGDDPSSCPAALRNKGKKVLSNRKEQSWV